MGMDNHNKQLFIIYVTCFLEWIIDGHVCKLNQIIVSYLLSVNSVL